MTHPIGYFDYNATTPMLEEAIEAWNEVAREGWYNPSGLYLEAGLARQKLEDCREELADLLEIGEPERILFTGGATEANNAVIRHLARESKRGLAVSSIEHPCVEAAVREYASGIEVVEIPVDPKIGAVEIAEVEKLVREGRVDAISVMAANNETGVIQPWKEIAGICREQEVHFHTDAAQWFGKLGTSGIDRCGFVTGSGHKFGAGKGVGFLVIPEDGAESFVSQVGGPQEEGRRAGTEDLANIAGMVAALAFRSAEALVDRKPIAKVRDEFETELCDSLGTTTVAAEGDRLWNTSMLLLPHSKNLKWLTRLSKLGFAVSTGSACSAGRGNPSKVMEAMGLDFEEMGRVLRISGGWETSEREWKDLGAALVEVGAELSESGRS